MRHPLHAICPYFAMFPEEFVARHLMTFTRPGDLVLDPFCGRGTTILESLLHKRRVIGTDVNWVAACIAGAKASVPELEATLSRLDELAQACETATIPLPTAEFFSACFHEETLRELSFLRTHLEWRNDDRDRFIAAVILGALHGESHRSPNYLSNRMPRTISTKPEYSVRWWKERNLLPERRETFSVARSLIKYRMSVEAPRGDAEVRMDDARNCGCIFRQHEGKVGLIVTSPPYLDTTDYSEDQWLRIWFLGGAEMPVRRSSKDDRYRNTQSYWQFLAEVWKGCAPLLASRSTIAIRIGGRKLSVDELREGLSATLNEGLPGVAVQLLAAPASSEIRKGQVNSFRPGMIEKNKEHDFVFRLAA